jgi:hypothetical protein
MRREGAETHNKDAGSASGKKSESSFTYKESAAASGAKGLGMKKKAA